MVCPRPPEDMKAGTAGWSRVAEPTQRATQTRKPKRLTFRDVCGPEMAPGLGAALLQCPGTQGCGRPGAGADPVLRHSQGPCGCHRRGSPRTLSFG